MIKHLVMIKFKPDYDKSALAALLQKLDALPAQIPQIISMTHGPDAGIGQGKFDYGVAADFATVEDCQAYLAHPAHQALGGAMMELMCDAASLQFSC